MIFMTRFHTTAQLTIMIFFFNCQGVESTNLSYKSLESQVVNCLTSHLSSLEHLLLIAVSCSALSFSQCLRVQGQVCCTFSYISTINQKSITQPLVLIRTYQGVKQSSRLTSHTESLGHLLSEFSQCLCVQGQGC